MLETCLLVSVSSLLHVDFSVFVLCHVWVLWIHKLFCLDPVGQLFCNILFVLFF